MGSPSPSSSISSSSCSSSSSLPSSPFYLEPDLHIVDKNYYPIAICKENPDAIPIIVMQFAFPTHVPVGGLLRVEKLWKNDVDINFYGKCYTYPLKERMTYCGVSEHNERALSFYSPPSVLPYSSSSSLSLSSYSTSSSSSSHVSSSSSSVSTSEQSPSLDINDYPIVIRKTSIDAPILISFDKSIPAAAVLSIKDTPKRHSVTICVKAKPFSYVPLTGTTYFGISKDKPDILDSIHVPPS